MDQREPGLVPDGVIAPDFGDVHAVLNRQPPGDIDAACRYIEVKRGARPAEVCPLRHRFEVIDRFGGFYLDRAHQLFASIDRRQHQVRENLDLPDAHRDGLVLADVGDHVVLALQFGLQEPDDTVVLELLADGPHQDWTHFASGTRQYPESVLHENGDFRSRDQYV